MIIFGGFVCQFGISKNFVKQSENSSNVTSGRQLMRGERPYHMLVSSRKLGDFSQHEPDIGPSGGQIVLMNSVMCSLQLLGRRH